MVLSGLAEGVDQLVGFTALDSDLELWAILPTSISEYEKDFLPRPAELKQDFKISFLSISSKNKMMPLASLW